MAAPSEALGWMAMQPVLRERLRAGANVAVVGCGRGDLVVSLATAFPRSVWAGFDAASAAVALARRSAALHHVSDRVTFEVAPPLGLLGGGYDLVLLDVAGWRLRIARGERHDR